MIKLGIIGAMKIELDTLIENMDVSEKLTIAGMDFHRGLLDGLEAVIVQCGVGKVNAAICTQILCSCFQVTHIVNTGVAGSLSAQLDIGDFVISRDTVYHDFDCHVINEAYVVGQVPGMSVRFFEADKQLVRCAYLAAQSVNPGHVQIGRITSGDQFVAQKEHKMKIVDDTEAICTEMEGTAIAHTAWKNMIPFVIMRAISDKADDSAHMDYPTFEAIAARQSADVTRKLIRILNEN